MPQTKKEIYIWPKYREQVTWVSSLNKISITQSLHLRLRQRRKKKSVQTALGPGWLLCDYFFEKMSEAMRVTAGGNKCLDISPSKE